MPSMRVYKTFSDEPMMVVGLPAPFNRLWSGDPETNRHAMREGLLATLGDAAKVQFQCGISEVKSIGEGEGQSALVYGLKGEELGEFDLVIDASGVATPLRKYRVPGTELKQWYTGIVSLSGMIQDPETELQPEVVRRLGQGGTLIVFGNRFNDNGALAAFLQRFGNKVEDHRSTFSIFFIRDGMNDLASELGVTATNRAISEADRWEAGEKIKAFLKKEMGDRWDPMYLETVDRMTNIHIPPLFMFPPSILPLTTSPTPIVCVGDALHALPPFTGSGGNLALKDAGELATFLVKYINGKDDRELFAGLREVELKCFKRAANIVTSHGEHTRVTLCRDLRSDKLWDNYTLKEMMQGDGNLFQRLSYWLLLFYMKLHRLSDYGMARPESKKP